MSDFDTAMELAGEAMGESLGVETVVYTPLGGVARSIAVTIARALPDPALDVPAARITARNHATLGIDGSSVDTGGDTIAWSPKRGGSAKISRIEDIVTVNAGMIVVEVR
jgi:hypothetical protein